MNLYVYKFNTKEMKLESYIVEDVAISKKYDCIYRKSQRNYDLDFKKHKKTELDRVENWGSCIIFKSTNEKADLTEFRNSVHELFKIKNMECTKKLRDLSNKESTFARELKIITSD